MTFVLTRQRRDEILDVRVIHAETAEEATAQEGFTIISTRRDEDLPVRHFLLSRGNEEWYLFETETTS